MNAQTLAPADPGMAPLLEILDLQDHLLSAIHDLTRLESLLEDACTTLLGRFHATLEQVAALRVVDAEERERAVQMLGQAVTGLQFQDLASQLIVHTCRRLDHCADRLAGAAFGADAEGEGVLHPAPLRPNPVAQGEVDEGSIELF